MKVKELLSIKGLECFSITSDQSLLDAAKQMAECNIGALLVMDRGVARGHHHGARHRQERGERYKAMQGREDQGRR